MDAPPQDVRRGPRVLRLPGMHVAAGLHAVAGPNGAGKSTLLAALAGLDGAPASVHGRPGRPGADLRWLSPRAEDHLTRSRVADEVDGAQDAVLPLLDATWHDRHPLRLSGGQRRRVALAKVLGRPAAAYLLDEPEAHLDDGGRAALQHIIAQRIDEGSAVVVATHDPSIIAAAHSVVRLAGTSVAGADGPASADGPSTEAP